MEATNFEREHQVKQDVRKPVEETGESGDKRLELASAIGNQGVQQVAASPALQRSPAAAGLLPREQIARATMTDNEEIEKQEIGEGEETQNASAGQEMEQTPSGEGAEQSTDNASAAQEEMPSGEEGLQEEEF